MTYMTNTTYALRSNFDGHVYPERFTADEAAAAMRLDPWITDPHAGNATLIELPADEA